MPGPLPHLPAWRRDVPQEPWLLRLRRWRAAVPSRRRHWGTAAAAAVRCRWPWGTAAAAAAVPCHWPWGSAAAAAAACWMLAGRSAVEGGGAGGGGRKGPGWEQDRQGPLHAAPCPRPPGCPPACLPRAAAAGRLLAVRRQQRAAWGEGGEEGEGGRHTGRWGRGRGSRHYWAGRAVRRTPGVGPRRSRSGLGHAGPVRRKGGRRRSGRSLLGGGRSHPGGPCRSQRRGAPCRSHPWGPCRSHPSGPCRSPHRGGP